MRVLFYIIVFKSLILQSQIQCTVDVNLAEFEHLANHLGVEECRDLIVLLHKQGFDKPSDDKLAKEKRLVPEEVGCLPMLLHWNSAQGEGLGKTHVELGHRLIQVGRKDLSEWLSQTVFKQLSQDLELTLEKDIIEADLESTTGKALEDEEDTPDDEHWATLDTIILVVVLLLTAAILLVLLRILLAAFSFKRTKKNQAIVESDPQQESLLPEEGLEEEQKIEGTQEHHKDDSIVKIIERKRSGSLSFADKETKKSKISTKV